MCALTSVRYERDPTQRPKETGQSHYRHPCDDIGFGACAGSYVALPAGWTEMQKCRGAGVQYYCRKCRYSWLTQRWWRISLLSEFLNDRIGWLFLWRRIWYGNSYWQTDVGFFHVYVYCVACKIGGTLLAKQSHCSNSISSTVRLLREHFSMNYHNCKFSSTFQNGVCPCPWVSVIPSPIYFKRRWRVTLPVLKLDIDGSPGSISARAKASQMFLSYKNKIVSKCDTIYWCCWHMPCRQRRQKWEWMYALDCFSIIFREHNPLFIICFVKIS